MKSPVRKYSVAFAGGEFGDEGKGRMTDKYVTDFAKKRKVVVYRDNGGANAGHTIEFDDIRVALHQLCSGIFVKNAVMILGKGMVLHPQDLISEIEEVKRLSGGGLNSELMIDEMAVLSPDTHRAYEAILKNWATGGHGSTARGISPAYADVVYKHPLRMRDLRDFNLEKITKHYNLYSAMVKGLDGNLATFDVARLHGTTDVGTLDEFICRLRDAQRILYPYIQDVHEFLEKAWKDEENYAFVFEKSQAIGLDNRYGVYPDVTESDCTFGGIFSSTECIIDPNDIEIKALVLKGTYMSSVGVRKIPTLMDADKAKKYQTDFKEFGATTGRLREIAYVDLPAIRFFVKASRANYLALTHLDAVYPEEPIKICIDYTLEGKVVDYRPDQDFLNKVKPVYKELSTYDAEEVKNAKSFDELPKGAKDFLSLLSKDLGIPILMVTTGPKRDQGFVI
jgi:adenylosuccinate synthase